MLKKFFEKTKYEACILVFLVVELVTFAPSTERATIWQWLLYLGDYSHGYMPRAFLGEVLSWFSDTLSVSLLYNLSYVVCTIMCFAIAVIGGQIIKKAENKVPAIGITAIMVSSPIFMPVMAGWLGITDIYLILLTLVAFAFNENKIMRYLIPAITLLCVAIHHAYMFLYMVPIAIALLYDFFKNKKYVRDGLLCGVTYASLIAFALFTVSSRNLIGFDSIDDMIAFMKQKAEFDLDAEWLKSIMGNEYFTGVDYLSNNVTSSMSASNLLGLAVIFAPLFVLFAYGWISAIKTSEKKEEKFVFFLCLIHPLSTIPAYIFGLNWNRWTSAIITSQCILYLFMLYRKNKTVTCIADKTAELFKRNFIPVIFYFIYYVSFAKLLGN